MANYDNFLAIFIFMTFFVSDVLCMIALSKETYQTVPGQVLAITCRDKSGQTVFWKGLKGEKLGPNSRPTAESRSFGKLLVFQNTRVEDSGEYVCHSKDLRETKIFTLSVEARNTEPEDEIQPFHKQNTNKRPPHRPPKTTPTPVTEAGPEIIDESPETKNNPVVEPDPEPIEIECPSELMGLETQDVRVSCIIKNKKKYSPSITWSINGSSIANDQIKYRFEGDSLIIKNVSKDDNGLVVDIDIISGRDGNKFHRKTSLVVYHQPYHVYDETDVYVAFEPIYKAYDEEFNLTCKVEANPQPVFKWFKNNRVLKHFITESDYVTILPLTMSQSTVAVYKCKVRNDHGEQERFYDVRLGHYPDPPLGLEVAGNTSETLELNVTLPDPQEDGMDPNSLVIEYRELENGNWSQVEYELNNTVIISMEKLQKGTTYEFRAATKNILGISEFTNTTRFQTSFAISVHANYKQILVSLFILLTALT